MKRQRESFPKGHRTTWIIRKVVINGSHSNALALHHINVELWQNGLMLNLIEVLSSEIPEQYRRSFNPEFKRDAASLVLDQNYTIPEASRAVDVGDTALRRWVEQLLPLSMPLSGITALSKAVSISYPKTQKSFLK